MDEGLHRESSHKIKMLHTLEKNVVYYDNGFWDYIRNYSEFSGDYLPEVAERRVADQFEYVMSPLLVCVGLPLQLLAAKIFSRLSDRYLPTCGFLLVASLMDALLLMVVSGNAWVTTWTQRDVINDLTAFSSGSCKFVVFLLHLFQQISNWSVVCYVYTTRCHLTGGCFGINWTSSHVTDLMVVGLVVLMCLNAQYFWTYDVMQWGLNSWDISPEETDPAKLALKEIKYCVFEARGMGKPESDSDPQVDYYLISVVLDAVTTDFMPTLGLAFYLARIAWRRRTRRKFSTRTELSEDTRQRRSMERRTPATGGHCVLVRGLTKRTPVGLCILQVASSLPLFLHVLCEQAAGVNHTAVTHSHQHEETRARWYLVRVLFLQLKAVCTLLRFPVYCWTSPQFFTILRHMGVWWKNLCLGRRDSLHTRV